MRNIYYWYRIIQLYAPTTDYEDGIIEKWYEQIEDITAGIPKKDFMIIQRDWNAKVGSDSHEMWFKAMEDMDWSILI